MTECHIIVFQLCVETLKETGKSRIEINCPTKNTIMMRENSRSWLNTREEIQQQVRLQPSDTKIRKLYAQQQRGHQQEI